MKRNFTIGVGANAGLAFQNGMSLSPVPSLDIKWDDRIDTIENATIRLGSYLDAATVVADEKITLDLTKVPQDIDPSLSNALTMLASIIEEGGGNLSPDEKMAHAILMKSRFLAAFKLSLAAESKLGGFSLSGVKFAFLPGALGFGPSFQNVGVARNAEIATKSEARKLTDISEQNTKLAEYGLKLDGKTLTQTAGFDATKITLKDGLAWDAGKSITLASNEAFVITGGLLSDTLGTSSGSLTIRKSVAKVAVSSSDIAATLISAENADLGADLNRLIDGLNIDTLIVRSDMQRFMAAMTKMDISTASNIMEKSTPALKAIHKVAKKENKLDAVTQVINARLVGDNITRGFNKAKSDPKFFVQYKNALIANAHSKGIEKKEITRLSALTRDKLTVGDISFVFNSKSLRNQELNIMSTTL